MRRSTTGKYLLCGRSDNGRYLFAVFAREGRMVRIITARDMTPAERRHYEHKRG